jgi:hypothetical protein
MKGEESEMLLWDECLSCECDCGCEVECDGVGSGVALVSSLDVIFWEATVRGCGR